LAAVDSRAAAQSRVRWELLRNLIRKDLKVKYQGSALGFVWSLATPLLLLAVYYIVFQIILKNGIPSFAVYLMAGLLPWQAFAGSTMIAASSVVANGELIRKIRFPQTVLPLSAVGFQAVHFLLQMGVLTVALVVTRYDFFGPRLLLLIPATVVLVTFSVGMAMLVSAANVRYRDVQHLLEIVLQAGFWLTPVVYAAGLVQNLLVPRDLYWAYFLNPMAGVISTFQAAFYEDATVPAPGGGTIQVLASDDYTFYLQVLLMGFGVSLVVLGLGVHTFRRLQPTFAEDL